MLSPRVMLKRIAPAPILEGWRSIRGTKLTLRGNRFDWKFQETPGQPAQIENPLEKLFLNRAPGTAQAHKWMHYLEIYHRHLAPLRDRPRVVLEIGIDRGGSISMWRDYFGPSTIFHGVDIDPRCRKYARDGVAIHIGDQTDRSFWTRFCNEVPALDVVIDDGGHEPEQQIVTLEELLPRVRPGGIYICEDVHGCPNEFTTYVASLVHRLNEGELSFRGEMDPCIVAPASTFQRCVNSIHFYPFVTVIERQSASFAEFKSRRMPEKRVDG